MMSSAGTPGAGTTIVIPSSVVEEIAKQSHPPVDKNRNLWHIAEQQMRDFVKGNRYGTISTVWQDGKLIQVEVRESYRT